MIRAAKSNHTTAMFAKMLRRCAYGAPATMAQLREELQISGGTMTKFMALARGMDLLRIDSFTKRTLKSNWTPRYALGHPSQDVAKPRNPTPLQRNRQCRQRKRRAETLRCDGIYDNAPAMNARV